MKLAQYYKEKFYPDLDLSVIEEKLADPTVMSRAVAHLQQTHYPDIPVEQIQKKVQQEPYISLPDVRAKDKVPFKASKKVISDIIKEANIAGVDPYTALALSFQETGIGDGWKDNPFHLTTPQTDNVIRESLDFLKQKMEYGKKLGKKSEAEIIQAWNGYGKITPKSEYGGNMYYGVDVSKNPIDMNKTPVYGNRILDIRDNVLKKNKEIQDLVSKTYKFDNKPFPYSGVENVTPTL